MFEIDRRILDLLDDRGVPYCLIGGLALAVRGYPRYTADCDLLTDDSRVLDDAFWRGFDPSPEVRRGDVFDPLLGVVRWGFSPPVDLVVAGGYAARLAVASATSEPELPRVATPLALVLLKLEAGGRFDLDDVARLLEVRASLGDVGLVERVEEEVENLTEAAREAWSTVFDKHTPSR